MSIQSPTPHRTPFLLPCRREPVFTSITSLRAHNNFFTRCPHLTTLEIKDMQPDTPLPSPPAPSSLQTIIVRCARLGPLDFVNLMDAWRGIRIPRFIVHDIHSLRGVLPLFLASHAQPVELRLTAPGHAVTLAAPQHDNTVHGSEDGAQSVWTIHHSPPWPSAFLGGVGKPASTRLTSISVDFARLGALFRARMHLPGLERLEIILGGMTPSEPDPSLVLSGDELFLRAPALRRFIFNFDNEYAHSRSAFFEIFQGALATLRESFRALILYDAGLLDAILVSHQIHRECARFAPLAKEYTLVSRGSRPLV